MPAPITYNDLYQFEGDTLLQPYGNYVWTSKIFIIETTHNFQFVRIDADFSASQLAYSVALANQQAIIARNAQKISSGVTGGAIGESVVGEYPLMGDSLEDVPIISAPVDYTLILKVYSSEDGTDILRHTINVYHSKPIALKGGFRSKVFFFELTGNISVKSLTIADTIGELNAQDVVQARMFT